MIIIGEKINGSIPAVADAIARRDAAFIKARALAQEEKSYSRYQDTLDAYRKDLSFLQTQADQAWERGHQSYLEGYQMGQDAYERMLYLIEERGYKPTKQELLELGFTEAQAAALGR